MSALPTNITPMGASFDSYIRHGWNLCPIPPNTKGPSTVGWNLKENALTLESNLPDSYGVGLLHAYSGTCAIDVDSYELAKQWLADRQVSIDQLFSALDAVHINSGNPGHGKLLYKTPLGMAIPSKKITVEKNGIRTTALEFRCATADGKTVQDVLPPSRHPGGTVYQWGGRGSWQQLPELPIELLNIWQELIGQDSQRNIPIGVAVPASTTETQSALFAIDPDCDRKTWVECGMALQLIGETVNQPEQLFELWNSWSKGSKDKYPGEREMLKQWQSFKPKEKGITAGTLFYHAFNAGWKRPAEDVTGMFAPVKEKTVESVKQLVSPGAKLPTADHSLWPQQLLNRSVEVSATVGCDVVVPLMAGLCAVSCALDKRSKLVISDTWKVPPTLWAMTIGEPADKKTPGSKPMFSPLRKLEIEDKPRFNAEMMGWEGKEAKYASQMKAYREFNADPSSEMGNTEPPPVEALPIQPQPLRLLINDATTQKVVTLAEHRPRGFLLWLDEMNNWFERVGNSRHTDDRGCWIQGYETGHYTMDRMGAGSIQVENFSLSIYGNCQPEVFRKHAAQSSSDGLLQRFIPIVLDAGKNAMWQQSNPSFMSYESEYEGLIRRIHSLPVFEYELDSEAMVEFRLFCEWAMELRANERLVHSSSSYNTALGKLEGNVARIMLLFHVIEEPYCPLVTVDVAKRVIALVKKFLYPMLRYTFITVGQQRDELGQVLIDYVIQCATVKTVLTMSDLRRATRHVTGHDSHDYKNDFAIRTVMEELISDGWANYLTDHPRNPSFVINPELATVYKDHRIAIIKAKQSVIDTIRDSIFDAGKDGNKVTQKAIGWDSI